MDTLPSTASSMQSNLPEENIWSMPVTIVMGLAIVAFAVGLCLAVRNMWNKHQKTSKINTTFVLLNGILNIVRWVGGSAI